MPFQSSEKTNCTPRAEEVDQYHFYSVCRDFMRKEVESMSQKRSHAKEASKEHTRCRQTSRVKGQHESKRRQSEIHLL